MRPRTVAASSPTALELVQCPDCRAVAEVEWRDLGESTSGSVQHVKLRCLHGHWFLMLAERLPSST